MKNYIFLILIPLLFACSNQSPLVEKKSKTEVDSVVKVKMLIDSLVGTIDSNYDILHSDYTPSILRLSELGIPAIEAIIPLLNNDNENTRLHAQRVFEGVINQMHGFIPGQGYSIKGGEEKVRNILKSIGYEWNDTSLDNRQKAIEKLKNWVLENKNNSKNQ